MGARKLTIEAIDPPAGETISNRYVVALGPATHQCEIWIDGTFEGPEAFESIVREADHLLWRIKDTE